MIDGDDKCEPVDICRQDMRLLAQICAAADDVVASGQDRGYPVRTVGLQLNRHIVADCHGIGGTDTGDAQIALDMAIHYTTGGNLYADSATG